MTPSSEEIAAALEAVMSPAVSVDEMSYHGELLRCSFCGGIGTRDGHKRGVEASPVKHETICPITTLRSHLSRLREEAAFVAVAKELGASEDLIFHAGGNVEIPNDLAARFGRAYTALTKDHRALKEPRDG